MAKSRCPCEPTYPTCKRISLGNSRLMVRLYCAEYCVRSFVGNCPKSKIGRYSDQSNACPRGGFRKPLDTLDLVDPSCVTNGALKIGFETPLLIPKGGSATNCSSTSCSIGL